MTIDLYQQDLGMGRDGLGLRMLQKSQEDYIKLTPRGRIKVKTAAVVCDKKQVFCKH